ncbi:MATE family efflux transporter [Novosphingopyxis baekryungensis]|uniref:MATE family efflux transporter n=1 Tax=Novosphingopyxis baekryungensis TaxID=279369 RepID=UPI0003B3A0F6|nr:MATE family efflux transporter [Novosphingopyxis baekryungensis]
MTTAATTSPAGSFRREGLLTLRLALPLVVGNLAQAAINTTDVLILGRYDVDALAAAALGVNLYWVFGVFCMGLVTATSPLIAAEYGARSNSVRDIRRTVRQAIWASAAICIPVWAILWHAEAIYLLLGQSPDLSEAAGRFVRIAMWGLFPWLVGLVLRYFVTALERPMWGVYVMMAGLGFNALACWVLVFGAFGLPELGLEGAAIANALAQTVLGIGGVLVVTGVRRFRRYRLFGNFWRPDWQRFRAIFSVGLPIAMTYAMEITVFSAAVFLMGLIGRASLAAHSVAIQIAALAFMVPLSIGQAATVRAGIFHGRADSIGLSRTGKVALALGLASAALSSLLMWLIPEELVGLFVRPVTAEDAEVFRLAVAFLGVAAVFQLVDSLQAVGAGLLRGIQDTRVPMLFAGLGYWVIGFTLGWYLAFHTDLAGVGVWIGLAGGLAATAVLMCGRWLMRGRLGLAPTAP